MSSNPAEPTERKYYQHKASDNFYGLLPQTAKNSLACCCLTHILYNILLLAQAQGLHMLPKQH